MAIERRARRQNVNDVSPKGELLFNGSEAERLASGEAVTLLATLNERRRSLHPQAIQQIISGATLPTTDPENLLKNHPFDKLYDALVGTYEDYEFKYVIATVLIDHFSNRLPTENGNPKTINSRLRFLSSKFAPASAELDSKAEILQEDLNLRVREALIKRGDPRETIQAANELEGFAQAVVEGKTVDAQDFRKLVGLFGSSRVVDILYRSRPEFRGIEVDQVRSILADYLGDFLLRPGFFNPDDVEVGLQYLSDPSFQEGLLEVIKENSLSFYNTSKRSNPNEADGEIFTEYFDILDLEIEGFNNENLRQVAEQARNYYASLLAIPKPSHIVEVLREGREFPDVNQLINIKELFDKKRMLIADEMRMGKSAAPILAKEALGIGQAVIVAQSNNLQNWIDYLSDKVEDGRQIGYFKEGQAPKVLVVDSLQTLQQDDVSSYDYIILSHERLNDIYATQLESVDFDMLVVDEVHKLKNLQNGVWSANLLRLAKVTEKDNGYLALLSGTPIPNMVSDVAMLLKLLYPEKFGSEDNRELVGKIIKGDLIDLRSLLIPRMQMKALRESMEGREHTERIHWFDLSPLEREIYEVLMEEDELEATDKMRILRQFVLNPAMLDITPGVVGSKITQVSKYLQNEFAKHDKVVMFVNDYVEHILRGDREILSQLGIPQDVEIRVIMGGVTQEERRAIRDDLNSSNKRMLVAINGQVGDVGNDYAGGQGLVLYNEPWTRYMKMQQAARLLGDRVLDPLESMTFIARDTIEEGMHEYINIKFRAIEKLLRGVPLGELEREMLEQTEGDEPDLEINPELAAHYFSSWDKMMKIFGYVKELGERDFRQFLNTYGKDYADCYLDLGSRSYQANASRVSASVIDTLVRGEGKNPFDVRILDIASGPEMLRKHIADEYQNRVMSLDINSHHFQNDGGARALGSFLQLPIQDSSVDIANLSLALHYTKFIPSRGEYERLQVLAEINRVLKVGGRATLNLMYNLDLRDIERFKKVVGALGFRVVEEYTGEVVVGQQYRSRFITLQKESDCSKDLPTLVEAIQATGKENLDGLKFKRSNNRLKDSRRIVTEFMINGNMIPVHFNEQDYQVLQEEQEIVKEAQQLQARYGDVAKIPSEEIIRLQFVRLLIGKHYALFKRLQKGNGAVVVK